MKNAKLTTDDILNKKFKKRVFGGVNTEEVDEFLNDVLDDYEYYINEINHLKMKNEELRKENFKVKMNVLKQNTQTIDLAEDLQDKKVVEQEAMYNKTLEQRIIELEKEVAVINAKIDR